MRTRGSHGARQAVFLVVLAALTTASAQSPRDGIITGVVLSTSDSARVPAARITIDSSSQQVTADEHGAFVLSGVAAGQHVLRVRRLGFVPTAVVVAAVAGGRTRIVVLLERSPQLLREITVHGQHVIDLPRFTAAVERARRNNGAVFTADQIRKENPLDTKALLERLPGVHVSDRGIRFDRCQDSGTLGLHDPPRVHVYIDNVRVTRDGPPAAFEPDDVNGVLSRIDPRSIAVMEVYTGIARIPAEYLANACAVVVIWTKAY